MNQLSSHLAILASTFALPVEISRINCDFFTRRVHFELCFSACFNIYAVSPDVFRYYA